MPFKQLVPNLTSIIGVFLILLANNVFAKEFSLGNCVFSQELHSDLNIYNYDHLIVDVQPTKYKSWAKNLISVMSTPSSGATITFTPEQKKTFKAEVEFYLAKNKLNRCKTKANFRITGDYKDHLDRNKFLVSTKINLKTAAIGNITSFKLFNMGSRLGINELMFIGLMREFGFMAPRTILAEVRFGKSWGTMILQEDFKKELLEYHKRREDFIFKGLEKEFVLPATFIDDSSQRSLPNFFSLDNYKYAEKNSRLASAFDAINVLNNNKKLAALKNMSLLTSQKNEEVFIPYYLLSIAAGATHNILNSNTKYYFDSTLMEFLPIYYDGNVIPAYFDKFFWMSEGDLSFLREKTSQELLEKMLHKLEYLRLNIPSTGELRFLSETTLFDKQLFQKKYELFFGSIIANLHTLRSILEDEVEGNFTAYGSLVFSAGQAGATAPPNILKVSPKPCLKIEKDCILGRHSVLRGGSKRAQINHPDVKHPPSKDNPYYFVSYSLPEDKDKTPKLTSKRAYSLERGYIEIVKWQDEIDTILIDGKVIKINCKSNCQILFRDASLKNYSISLVRPDKAIKSDERVNRTRNLTGGLTFIDTVFDNTELEVTNQNWEDALNIIRGRGSIKSIHIKNAAYDGADFDFSELEIDYIDVAVAGNDCLDLSSGKYKLQSLKLASCKDKGLSVGEGSIATVNKFEIHSAYMGLGVKDSSTLQLTGNETNFIFKDVVIQQSAYNKKQEYGGAAIAY